MFIDFHFYYFDCSISANAYVGDVAASVILPIDVAREAGLIIEFKNTHHHHFMRVGNLLFCGKLRLPDRTDFLVLACQFPGERWYYSPQNRFLVPRIAPYRSPQVSSKRSHISHFAIVVL